ncbi:MAG: 2-oxoglutarate dehydrogenase, E2 component, dihydrolipoamide succinyltransferase [Bryobacteraceae bacterium]|nr:2-oxoglutarate dehydrogenase, E2 component, dihydrolipoamide succinyltransferase [Bryobacteraceae bacterium]MDW8376938.1 2-oxoglutarate dehydrogenase, E2 component, dihydrolipoamide succinyltransferase [Bryobacterales bacterium]
MIDVVMPQMGESIVEGTLTKWLKKAGDRVERDEPLFEISTDKVDSEIPSPAAGILAEVLVNEGTTVAINTVVARIQQVDEVPAGPATTPAEISKPAAPPAAAPPPVPPAPAASAPPAASPALSPPAAVAAPAAPATPAEPVGPLSPLVRRMAREYNIDLSQVRGTGAGGRITKADLEAYMAAQGARTAAASMAPAPAPIPAAPPAAEVPPVPRTAPAKTRVEPMSTMRAKIAEHMVFSKRTSAHVTTVHRADVTKIANLRERLKAQFQERYGFSLTYLPFVVRAAAEALRTFPIVNASIEGTNIIYHNEINIGIAVALDGGTGLIVPVIRNADERNVVGLQRAIVDLAGRARSKQLKPDEVQGGTFSITNFGSFGSIFATPVINQPQVAILGVGAVEKTPVVVDDAIAIRSICHLALTFDHRLIDGALADQFCQKVKQILENWSEQVL